MAKRQSAGILLYRRAPTGIQVFLVLPCGPFWAARDAGAWTIPKGEFNESETPLQAAVREFKEETGVILQGNFIALTAVVQKAGKQVFAWALQGDLDAGAIKSNTFKIEWPPKSGNWQTFPEVAKGEWFEIPVAKEKNNPAQCSFLNELLLKIKEA